MAPRVPETKPQNTRKYTDKEQHRFDKLVRFATAYGATKEEAEELAHKKIQERFKNGR